MKPSSADIQMFLGERTDRNSMVNSENAGEVNITKNSSVPTARSFQETNPSPENRQPGLVAMAFRGRDETTIAVLCQYDIFQAAAGLLTTMDASRAAIVGAS